MLVMKNEIDTPIAKLTYNREENILHIKIIEGSEMNVNNTIEHYKLISQLTSNNHYGALVDGEHYIEIDYDALKLAAYPEVLGKRIATAHFSKNIANKLTVLFFKNNIKPHIPIEYFRTEKDAIGWLKAKIFEFSMNEKASVTNKLPGG